MINSDFNLEMHGFVVRLVQEEDADFILSLRSDVNRTKFMVTLENDVAKQKLWIKEYKEREDKGEDFYFIYFKNGERIGVNRISHINKKLNTCKLANMIKRNSAKGDALLMFYIRFYIVFNILKLDNFYGDFHINNNKAIRYWNLFGYECSSEINENGYVNIYGSANVFLENIDSIKERFKDYFV